ncbi:hypothetical protein C8046_17760 [Serinibacter arcticus]|uniref:Vitamin K epoxide reductase domain-containing protein n=2 Tax=Serinibacter arcticus TaxID=1655435 RepID=A0A2U1ZZ57_9MICO|nr:hypothetical protein C8046_17760 [Serinibacter arcticus]
MYGPSGGPPARGSSTIINTMSDPMLHTGSPAASLRPLTTLVGTLALLGSFVALGWRWSQDASVALDLLSTCPVGSDPACPVQPTIRQALLDPLLLAAGMFALSVGALVDSRHRPLTGLLLAVGAVVLGVLVVTG